MSHRAKEEVPPEIVPPVVPFLDMAFQLMFFFLATFNPSSVKEGQMDMSLPSESEKAAHNPADVKPLNDVHKEEVDIPDDFTINIRGYRDVRNRGLISALSVKTNAGVEELKGGRDDRERLLREKLTGVKPSGDKDGKSRVPTVRMSAESDVRWEQVMRIMDICYRAGFQVSFTKPPDLGTSAP